MNPGLLQTLFDDPSGGQIAGGIMMIIVFSSVGAIAASALAVVARRIFLGKYEQLYWAVMLFVIAAIYLGFAGWFQASGAAWETELAGVAVFAGVALLGAFSSKALALGYFLHGLWDVAHSLFGTSILGHTASEIPLGYGMFCVGFDFAAAVYLLLWANNWDHPGSFHPGFWRQKHENTDLN